MSNVNGPRSRSFFFPKKREQNFRSQTSNRLDESHVNKNDSNRVNDLEKTKTDAKVMIPDKVRDFSRIRKAVDMSSERDNSQKIAALREQIRTGSYKVDFDGLADKVIESEF
jgi:negative regulator of flagellin synthesis FlgM